MPQVNPADSANQRCEQAQKCTKCLRYSELCEKLREGARTCLRFDGPIAARSWGVQPSYTL